MVASSPLGNRVAARSLMFVGVQDRGTLYRINVAGGPRNVPLSSAVWHCGPGAPEKATRATAEALLRICGANYSESVELAGIVARRRLKGCQGVVWRLRGADLVAFLRAFRRQHSGKAVQA